MTLDEITEMENRITASSKNKNKYRSFPSQKLLDLGLTQCQKFTKD